jgi:hypothetical protein
MPMPQVATMPMPQVVTMPMPQVVTTLPVMTAPLAQETSRRQVAGRATAGRPLQRLSRRCRSLQGRVPTMPSRRAPD